MINIYKRKNCIKNLYPGLFITMISTVACHYDILYLITYTNIPGTQSHKYSLYFIVGYYAY